MAEKLKKKYINIGAPLWMSQFTAVMLILIVFFMILVTMSKKQESGYKSGQGKGRKFQKNALGIYVGTGTFRFGNYGHARTFAPNPGAEEDSGPPKVHEDLLKGAGGLGNTDLNLKSQQDVRFLTLPIPAEFPAKSGVMTQQMKEDIHRIAIAVAMESDPIIVKCFANDDTPEMNATLALARAQTLAREMSRFGGIPLSNIKCVGYSGFRYLGKTMEKAISPTSRQLNLVQLSVPMNP